MLASAVPGLVGWTVIAAAPGSVLSAVSGRFLVGVGMGIAGAIYPVGSSLHYEPSSISSISSISPPLPAGLRLRVVGQALARPDGRVRRHRHHLRPLLGVHPRHLRPLQGDLKGLWKLSFFWSIVVVNNPFAVRRLRRQCFAPFPSSTLSGCCGYQSRRTGWSTSVGTPRRGRP